MNPSNLDLSKSAGILCECGHNLFKEVFAFRKFSKFITGTSADAVLPLPIYICTKCDTILEETLAPELKEFFKPEIVE